MQQADFRFEKELWKEGLSLVAGIDEVGRGAWAGPLCAAAVIFPAKTKLPFSLFDSKVLSPEKRLALSPQIRERAFNFSFGWVEVSSIERYGISWATEQAMLRALNNLRAAPNFVLIDYFNIRSFPRERQKGIKKGDQYSVSIAAASILAKVERDRQMSKFDQVYPGYNFSAHKGYGTKGHQEAIKKLGVSPIHRKSFVPEDIISS